jgi:hypothetical protein
MNSNLDWLDFYDNQKCTIWQKKLQKSFFSLYFKNTVPRVSLLFTLSATVNHVYAMILRACKCIKSETRELTIFSLKIVSSIARGSSPCTLEYQAGCKLLKS